MNAPQQWSPAWFSASIRKGRMTAWCGVEAQHVVSTMRLVDSADEQSLLEDLLEQSKPPLPATRKPQHYLLTTPFRYRPAHASRFRPGGSQGQWYGARQLLAACAEVAYWRHRFILDSAGLTTQELLTQHTFFQAVISGQHIDLMREPWSAARSLWTHGSDYTHTHAVAEAAQAQGVQWQAYESVRLPGHRCGVVFDPACLAEPKGGLDATQQTWLFKVTRERVLLSHGLQRHSWVF